MTTTPDDRVTYHHRDTYARGWPPLLDWLTAHDIDPTIVTELTYTAGRVTLTEYVLDEHGRRRYRKTPRGVPLTELETRTRTIPTTTPPPRHPNLDRLF